MPYQWPDGFKLSKTFDCGEYSNANGTFEVLPIEGKRKIQMNISSYQMFVQGAKHFFARLEIDAPREVLVKSKTKNSPYEIGQHLHGYPLDAPARFTGHDINLCYNITEEIKASNKKLQYERYRVGDVCSQYMSLTEAIYAVVEFYKLHFDPVEWNLVDSYNSSLLVLRDISPGAYEQLNVYFSK